MEHHIRSGRRAFGFTLIELMIVMAITSILMAIAIPMYQKSVLRAKESVLRQNLFTLRTVIDEYTYDKAKAPQSLNDLVSEGYLRQVPVDPMTAPARLADRHGGCRFPASIKPNRASSTCAARATRSRWKGTPYNEW